MFLVALTWHVLESSHGIGGMAMAGIALALPQLALFPLAGLLADRADRRVVMLTSDLIRCACLLVMVGIVWQGPTSLLPVLSVVAGYGAATALFGPSFDAIVPALVPASELTAANALDQLMRPVALRMVGPAAGGTVVGIAGTGVALLLDAVFFATSAALLLGLPRLRRPAPQTSPLKDLYEGVNYMRSQPWLWATLAAGAAGLLIFIGPSEVLVPYLVKEVFGGSAGQLGLVYASGGVGAVVAAVVVGQAGLPNRYLTFTYLAWTIATLAVAGYGLAANSMQMALVCAVVGAGEAAGMIAWATAKQQLVPRRLLGRVSSVDWFVSTALVPLSYALTAPVAHVLGARTTLVWAGLLGGATTLAFLFIPDVRRREVEPSRPPDERPEPLRHRHPPTARVE
jgi:MFS family permease